MTSSREESGFPMDRRKFIKMTSLAGSALATGGILGAIADAANTGEQPLGGIVTLPLPGVGMDFAIVGDFGAGNYVGGKEVLAVNPDCLAVANGIKKYAPIHGSAYVISVGDQIYIPYESGNEFIQANVANYDTAIGQLYYPYIKFPTTSTSQYKNKGSKTQRFFCVIGDHDWWHQPRTTLSGFISYDADSLGYPQNIGEPTQYLLEMPGQVSAFMDYFSEQGSWSTTLSPRYYDLLQGDIHWFALSSDPNETLPVTEGATTSLLSNAYNFTGTLQSGLTAGQDNLQNSVQGQWLAGAMQESASPWKIVFMHNPPFVSSQPGAPYDGHWPAAYMQWGYDQLGADAVIAGHCHAYERLFVNGCTYIVCGSGGTFEAFAEFNTSLPSPASVVQVQNRYGFMTGKVTPQKLELLYVVVNSQGAPGVQETMDRCILLKDGTLQAADKPAQVTSIIVTSGGGAVNATSNVKFMPGALLGSGIFTKNGPATLTLTGSNFFTGTLALAQGALQLGGNQTLFSASTLLLAGGQLDAQGVSQSYETPLILHADSQLVLNEGTQLAFGDSSQTYWSRGNSNNLPPPLPIPLLVLQGPLLAQTLRFGTTNQGLTAEQCQQIRIGSSKGPSIQLDENGYVLIASS